MRSIPFPRITSPMAQDWNPQGLQLASLRHPIRNFRQMLKAKWNNAHCDPLVFAGIKATPWAEQESYTYITITALPDDTKNESAMQQATQSLHAAFLSALQKATD